MLRKNKTGLAFGPEEEIVQTYCSPREGELIPGSDMRAILSGSTGNLYLSDSKGKTRVLISSRIGVKTYEPNGQVLHELGKGSGSSGPHTHTATSTTTTTIR